ncbi:hypothetical protein Lgra_3179 [Legionella gratiana]|uniref:Fe-S protein n=1 Tax=Legionella gratiana TaxID=45066 RepID=A0A378JE15_9GAMM|nr:hypothetical protein [Legionella gratiana]KTD06402.1 hypothetical protein Lgra_3179 [Legionella gratiana]STX45221.1 Uncharacterised protein [Legionella gratiana]
MQERIYSLGFRGLFLLLLIYPHSSKANQPLSTNELPSRGNYSLVTSQQPGPFFSFGQNIVDKNQLIVSYNPSYLYSKGQSILEGDPALLYGITDSMSLLVTLPYAFSYNNGDTTQSGIGDLAIDLEYAFYNFENSKYSDQATIIFSPTFPISNLDAISKKTNPSQRVSGFSRKNVPSNFNAISYFIGGTYSRMLIDWYGFLAPGVLLIEKQNAIQQGTQYYYNLGIGHTIKSIERKYICSGLLELNGQYSGKTIFASNTVPNTGGNIIYITPSLWFSTPKIIVQVGISLPITQYWYGTQSKISYYTGSIITWTIH